MNALACGGLVAPNGTINLLKTTTLAAYHRGIEHYVTSFEFAGEGAAEVGSIVPLPGVPTRVVKAGGWTLQRLVEEVTPPPPELEGGDFAAATASPSAQVLLEAQIDALDITVLKGGAVAVGAWAKDHGFFLPPDAPEVLEFYAERSPIFMAARFNAGRAEAQGVQTGEGTPIHVAIPTPNPWVPLRILGLGPAGGRAHPGRRVPVDGLAALDAAASRTSQRGSRPTWPDPGGERAGIAFAAARSPVGRSDAVVAEIRSLAHLHPHQRGGRPSSRTT